MKPFDVILTQFPDSVRREARYLNDRHDRNILALESAQASQEQIDEEKEAHRIEMAELLDRAVCGIEKKAEETMSELMERYFYAFYSQVRELAFCGMSPDEALIEAHSTLQGFREDLKEWIRSRFEELPALEEAPEIFQLPSQQEPYWPDPSA